MCLWMDYDDVFNPRRSSEDDPPPPPIPRKSYIEIDFQVRARCHLHTMQVLLLTFASCLAHLSLAERQGRHFHGP